MKRFSLIAIIILAANMAASAQGVADALRYSEKFYVGSARTMAMGNAFTALGGDLGAMSINPASTAVYNCCEFAITGGFSTDKNAASFETTEDTYTQNAKRRLFNIPNISMVMSLPTGRDAGLVNYTLGFGFNKIASFNNRVSYSGYDSGSSLLGNIADNLETVNESFLKDKDAFELGYCTPQEILAYDTFLVNPYNGSPDEEADSYIGATENQWGDHLGVNSILDKSYDRIRRGGIYDMAFNFGLNFNDRLYLGINANINMVDFEDDWAYYEDGGVAGNYFDSGFKSMSYNYLQQTSGVGANVQVGAIWVPFKFLRLGATYTTPTIYDLTDTWRETMVSSFDGTTTCRSAESQSPVFSYEYRVHAPSRYSLGAALVFGHSGLISFDYETVDYSATKMSDYNHNYNTFKEANKELSTCYGRSNIFRMGAELNIFNDFAIRGGYTSYLYEHPLYRYVSFGIGKRISETSSIDLTYRARLTDTYSMLPYDDYAFNEAVGEYSCLAPMATISNTASDLMLTYRVKF